MSHTLHSEKKENSFVIPFVRWLLLNIVVIRRIFATTHVKTAIYSRHLDAKVYPKHHRNVGKFNIWNFAQLFPTVVIEFKTTFSISPELTVVTVDQIYQVLNPHSVPIIAKTLSRF